MAAEISKLKEGYIEKYCQDQKYTISKSRKDTFLRIDVSNMKEKIPLSLYDTGTLSVGGSPSSSLKKEFEVVKKQMDETPEILKGIEMLKAKSCASKYNILLPETRKKIQDALQGICTKAEFLIEPTPSEEYRAKLTTESCSLSITQYRNGTLFLQGKEDMLYNDTCDLIEQIATPSAEEVISRFLAGNDEVLSKFTSAYTPKLLEDAELQVRKILSDDFFNFLELHDQKWLVAAECLRITNIPLPEFSPIVMPASKAFEGFIKKLLVKINFYPPNHFSTKGATFSGLKDKTFSERKALEAKEMHVGTYLDKIGVCLDTNRNFMMHSDGNQITKIEKYEDAVLKLDEIHDDLKEIYKYFKQPVFGLS